MRMRIVYTGGENAVRALFCVLLRENRVADYTARIPKGAIFELAEAEFYDQGCTTTDRDCCRILS